MRRSSSRWAKPPRSIRRPWSTSPNSPSRRPTLSLRLIGVVESKSALTSRIKHILNRPLPKSAKLGLLGLLVIFLIAAVLLPMAKGQTSGGLFGRDVLIRLRHADKPGEDYRKADATETYTKNYTVSFQKGEKLAVVAELYQVGQPMRPLGSKIFVDPGHTQRLSIVVTRKYLNKDQTAIEHSIEVVLGQEALRVSGVVVNTPPPSPFVSPTRGWPTKPDLVREKRDGKPYVEFTQLLTIDVDQDDRPDRPPIGTWRPDHLFYTDVLHSDAYFLTIKALPLSQLSVLQVYPPHGGMQLLDGTILAADASKEQCQAVVEKYRRNLSAELTGHEFQNAQEALAVSDDLYDSRQIRRAMQAIEQNRPPVDFGARLRPAVTESAQPRPVGCNRPASKYAPAASRWGCAGFREFLDPALAVLDWRDPANRQETREAQYRVALGLGQYMENMPPADIERLKQYVLHCDSGYTWGLVFEHCFQMSTRPVVSDALWELAQEKQPWLWWPAMQALLGRHDERLTAYSALPKSLKLRVILAARREPPDTGALAPDVRVLLRSAVTVELLRMYPLSWGNLHAALRANLDRKEATAAYMDFLAAALSSSTQRRFEQDYGSAMRLYEIASAFLWDINFWYGINLGQLGTYKPEVGYPNTIRTARAFEQAVAEALKWYQANGQPQPPEPFFAGRVVDTSGRPVAGATITLTWWRNVADESDRENRPPVEIGPLPPDADGHFVFRDLANTGSYCVTIRAQGYVPRERLVVDRWPDGRFQVAVNTRDNMIVLEKPASLSGRVVGSDGRPPVARMRERIPRAGRPTARAWHGVGGVLPHARRRDAQRSPHQHRGTVHRRPTHVGLSSGELSGSSLTGRRARGLGATKAFQLVRVEEGQAVENVTLDAAVRPPPRSKRRLWIVPVSRPGWRPSCCRFRSLPGRPSTHQSCSSRGCSRKASIGSPTCRRWTGIFMSLPRANRPSGSRSSSSRVRLPRAKWTWARPTRELPPGRQPRRRGLRRWQVETRQARSQAQRTESARGGTLAEPGEVAAVLGFRIAEARRSRCGGCREVQAGTR